MGVRRIDYQKCNDCTLCYLICPMDVFGLDLSKVYVKYPEDCMSCFQCALVCKPDAITVDHERVRPIPPEPLARRVV